MIFITTLFGKLKTVKELVSPLSKRYCFRTPFDSEHVKVLQTLAKAAREHFNIAFLHY